MTLNLVTRVPKRQVRANQRHSNDVLVSGRIKAPIAAQRIGGHGCGNELHCLRKACFVDLGSFAHGHPPVKGLGTYPMGGVTSPSVAETRTETTC
jgi:hypothetical protein